MRCLSKTGNRFKAASPTKQHKQPTPRQQKPTLLPWKPAQTYKDNQSKALSPRNLLGRRSFFLATALSSPLFQSQFRSGTVLGLRRVIELYVLTRSFEPNSAGSGVSFRMSHVVSEVAIIVVIRVVSPTQQRQIPQVRRSTESPRLQVVDIAAVPGGIATRMGAHRL